VELFLVRHAIAELRDEGRPDPERALTVEGREKLNGVIAGLARLDVELDHVVHSPWRRATQTAHALKPLTRTSATLVSSEELARPPRDAIWPDLLGERVAVVGHQPWLGELCAWLVTGDREQGGAFPFKKAGVAWLEGDPRPGGCVLRAFLPPRVLRRLAR
jgi:phosphohistidine phosphatase